MATSRSTCSRRRNLVRWSAPLRSHYASRDPSSPAATSPSGRRGVDGNGSAFTGAHPTRNNICGYPLPKDIGLYGFSRFGDLQRFGDRTARHPRAVAVSSTKLVASPERSLASLLSSLVPRANTTAPSSAGWVSAVDPMPGRPDPARYWRCWVRWRRVARRNAGHRGVPPAPGRELFQVILVSRMLPDRLRHNVLQPWKRLDLTQHHAARAAREPISVT